MNSPAPEPAPKLQRGDFPRHREIAARWSDFDMLRHLNNVQFYRFFEYLIIDNLTAIGSDLLTDPIIPYTVESGCNFLRPISPSPSVDAALRVAHLGHSSVRYEAALFEKNHDTPSALGRIAQVYIDRNTEKPTAIPPPVRAALEKLRAPSDG